MSKTSRRPPISLVIISFSDREGGAHRAVFRINQAIGSLPRSRIASKLLVSQSVSEDPSILQLDVRSFHRSPLKFYLQSYLRKLIRIAWRAVGVLGVHSFADIETGMRNQLSSLEPDLVMLNWLGDFTISLREISEIDVPIILRTSDHWFWSESNHFTPSSSREVMPRAIRSILSAFFLSERYEELVALKHKTLAEKAELVVCPSMASLQAARESGLFAEQKLTVIPNPIPTDFWEPQNRFISRAKFQVNPGVVSVGFGASDVLRDKRKGLEEFRKIMSSEVLQNAILETRQALEVHVFGNNRGKTFNRLGDVTVHWHGVVDEDELRHFFSAMDVYISSSKTETFGNTVLEAQSCGCPVIAPKGVGGYDDIIQHSETGFLSASTEEAIDALVFCITNPKWLSNARTRARLRALAKFKPETIAARWERELLRLHHGVES